MVSKNFFQFWMGPTHLKQMDEDAVSVGASCLRLSRRVFQHLPKKTLTFASTSFGSLYLLTTTMSMDA